MESESFRLPLRRSGNPKPSLRKAAAIVLFLFGIALILLPVWERNVQEREQLRLLTQWDRLHEPDSADHPIPADVLPTTALSSIPAQSEQAQSEAPVNADAPAIIDGMAVLGTIVIDKIDLREPILEGSTERSLRIGIGTVVPDRLPGQAGNFVLAGHNSRKKGLHFSRLQELVPGDEVAIETLTGTHVYKVTSTFHVKPDNLTVLDQDDTTELTLITCDRVVNPTERYIVKAVLQEKAADLGREGE